MSMLDAKIRKLESAVPDVKPYPRVLRLVANNREEADELARTNGFHPGDDREDELIINHILVSPRRGPREPIKPYVIGRCICPPTPLAKPV